MPNILTFRPCDVVETAEAWQIALETEDKPSLLALTRQGLPLLRTSAEVNLSAKGGYVIAGEDKKRQATIIATGSEVSLAVEAMNKLAEEGIKVAVVSMPCTELFDAQPIDYQEQVLGKAPRIAVEAASKFGWEKYVGLEGDIIGMDGFGASGRPKSFINTLALRWKKSPSGQKLPEKISLNEEKSFFPPERSSLSFEL